MKILRNKTYQGMVDSCNRLLEERNKLEEKYISACEQYQTVCDKLTSEKMDLEEETIKLTELWKKSQEEKKKLLYAKGGYTKEINKLKKQVEELTFKLEESMTDKYLVKKIKPGRTPKGQPMKIKDCSRISSISRKVFSS